MPASQSHGDIFLVKARSSQVTLVLVCIKLTKQMLTPEHLASSRERMRPWDKGYEWCAGLRGRARQIGKDQHRWEGAPREGGKPQERGLHRAV